MAANKSAPALGGELTSIDQVLDQLRALVAWGQEQHSRIAWFAALYLRTTTQIKAGIDAGDFDDCARMTRMDLTFASRYLDAVAAFLSGDEDGVSAPWKAAFGSLEDDVPLVIQHLFASMNAHIDFDLGVAAAEVGGDDMDGFHADFNRINDILYALVPVVDGEFRIISPRMHLLNTLWPGSEEELAKIAMGGARWDAWRFAESIVAASDPASVIDARATEIGRLGTELVHPGFLVQTALLPIKHAEMQDIDAITDLLMAPPERTDDKAMEGLTWKQREHGKEVAIFGGGAAGLTVAHELQKRGFSCTIYEASQVLGGKITSVGAPGSGTDGRADLPAEHGFHFYPGFYRHVVDTMKDIPFGSGTVYDNVVFCERNCLATRGNEPIEFPTRFPRSLSDLRALLSAGKNWGQLGVPLADTAFFGTLLAQLAMSHPERWDDYETSDWYDYTEAGNRSAAYRMYLAAGPMRTTIAAKASEANVATVGTVALQFGYTMAGRPRSGNDRVLNGAMNPKWIDPWIDHLRAIGVQIQFGQSFVRLHARDGAVQRAVVRGEDGVNSEVSADYYVLAIPVEALSKLVDDELIRTVPTLSGAEALAKTVTWMNGIQLYLKRDVPVTPGHIAFLDSPWALTAISQAQFWDDTDWSQLGDGNARGCFSIIISEWDTPGPELGLPAAKHCTRQQLIDGVIAQVDAALGDSSPFAGDNLHSVYIDEALSFTQGPDGQPLVENSVMLLRNQSGTWGMRPPAATRLPNLAIAGDWVRTSTRLACVEGANEAGKRAALHILDFARYRGKLPKVYELRSPLALRPFWWFDKQRLDRGLPFARPGVRSALETLLRRYRL